MKELQASAITKAIKELCINACCHLPEDVFQEILKCKELEESPSAKIILADILENAKIAHNDEVPICQDTGLAVIFVECGQDLHIIGNLEDAINEGVRQGYTDGYLRKSMVSEPLFRRENTKDNTPAVIHYKIVDGDKLKMRLAPKGAGSENKSIVKMLIPADGIDGVKKLVLETVLAAGPNSCPPLVIGVGIGGSMEMAAINSKKACIRDIETYNPDPRYAQLEDELLEMINKTGIGPQGLGGTSTALKVHIEWYPTHIAMLPVAININCHAARHAHIEL